MFIAIVGFYACEKDDDTTDVAALQQEIEQLKALLEQQNAITNVDFVDGQMVLTFASGASFTTATPANIIPTVGDNGNWWVNGEDLGVTAEAEMPSIGTNGNWWIGDTDTGVQAQGETGDAGADGTGIANVEYDPQTAILTITLTDGSAYEYKLFYEEGEDELQGIKLGDLNGKYLLSGITNGDFPFADFVYNTNNQLTEINYYTAVFNAPVKNGSLLREYNTDGKIAKQSFVEYATMQKAVPVDNSEMSVSIEEGALLLTEEEAFNEIYPDGLSGYTGTPSEFFNELGYENIASGDYLYHSGYYGYYDEVAESYQYMVYKKPIKTTEKSFFLTTINEENYIYGPWFDRWDNEWYSWYEGDWAYSADEIVWNDGYFSTGDGSEYQMYGAVYSAVDYTGDVDEIEGSRLKDYEAIAVDDLYNPENISGNFKIFMGEYDIYNQGDEIQRATFAYAYEGANYKVNYEDEDVIKVVVNNDKIESLIAFDEEDGSEIEVLKLNYTDNKLVSIDAPEFEATEVVKLVYDSQGNAIEYQVNAKALEGEGFDELFAALGLAYQTEVYDETLGMVVEKYVYPEDYSALLKVNYDYTMKNFMNHTITASNPLFSAFNMENAIQELIWAGHGSCFVAEYEDFNEGGYPTQFKGYLNFSPLEEGEYDNVMEIPLNVSVATSYKLEYIKIEE